MWRSIALRSNGGSSAAALLSVGWLVFVRAEASLATPAANYAVYSPDGQLLITTDGGVAGTKFILVYHLGRRHWGTDYGIDPSATTLNAFISPDGTYLITESIYWLKTWETERWTLVSTIEPGGLICDSAFSPDGSVIAVVTCGPNGGSVYLVDPAANRKSTLTDFANDGGNAVRFTSQGYLAAMLEGEETTRIEIWDTEMQSLIRDFEVPSTAYWRRAWSVHGDWLAMGLEESGIQILNLSTGEVESLPISYSIHSLAFSLDGSWLVAGGDQPAIIINTSTWQVESQFGWADVSHIAFSPNGERVITLYRAEYSGSRSTMFGISPVSVTHI
jgi:WD40 repeat protein